jgi:YVTN family beta-propeller protein
VTRTVALAVGLSLTAPALADTAWVTNQSSGDVTVVDVDAGAALATIEIGGQPAGVAAASDGRHVYIVSPDTKTITEIETATRTVSRVLVLEEGGPTGIATAPDGERLYVTDWYGARIFVIDRTALELVGEIEVGTSPSGIAVTPDGTRAVTADRDDDQISIIDLETGTRRTVETGERPFGITINAEGTRAYTADVGTDTVTVVNLESGTVIGSVPTGERPYAVALAQGKGFATDQYAETITVFDLNTFAVIDTLDSGEYPEGIATTSDGDRIVFANWFSNSIWVMDAATFEVISEIEVGDGPRAFGQFLTAD